MAEEEMQAMMAHKAASSKGGKAQALAYLNKRVEAHWRSVCGSGSARTGRATT